MRPPPPRSTPSRPPVPPPALIPRRTPSPSPAPFPAGSCCSTHTEPRASTKCRLVIRCAEEGFPVHSRVAWDWSLQVEKLRRAGNRIFFPAGERPGKASFFVQTALAGTLRAISARRGRLLHGAGRGRHGRDAQGAGGAQTEEDFANGRFGAEFVELDPAVRRGLDVWQCPPNGPGLVALMILGQSPGSVGSRPGRTGRRDAAPPAYRGGAPGLPRSRRVPCRPARTGRSHLLAPDYLAAFARLIDDERSSPSCRRREMR